LSRLLVSSRPLGAGDPITQRACPAIGMRFSRIATDGLLAESDGHTVQGSVAVGP